MKTFALAAATLGLAVTATPAFAGPIDVRAEVPVEKVSLKGLDLESSEGQKMLDQRIYRAAKSVCQVHQAQTGTRLGGTQARACVAKARASAKRQVASVMESTRMGG